jgi:hypothetical protein
VHFLRRIELALMDLVPMRRETTGSTNDRKRHAARIGGIGSLMITSTHLPPRAARWLFSDRHPRIDPGGMAKSSGRRNTGS